ncbi:MAG TPA: hypothetical protein VIZ28_08945 [Chitinophagaceae bacterium]
MRHCSHIIFGLLVTVMLSFSCSVVSDIGNRKFVYYKNDKEKKLVYTLPKGRSEEKFRVGGNDAKEQFYYFGDGSVFYVARNITWQTVNQYRIDALDATKQKGTAFNGKDKDGLYWKEMQFEEFRIGYAYVAVDKLERFDNALNSVKIR